MNSEILWEFEFDEYRVEECNTMEIVFHDNVGRIVAERLEPETGTYKLVREDNE